MAKKKPINPKTWLPDIGLIALRFCIAFIFIYTGVHKVTQMELVIEMLVELNFPTPVFFAYLLAYTELIAGILLLFGVFTRSAATLIGMVMLVALLTYHLSSPVNESFAAIGLLGSSILLITTGPGKWSLESMKSNRMKK